MRARIQHIGPDEVLSLQLACTIAPGVDLALHQLRAQAVVTLAQLGGSGGVYTAADNEASLRVVPTFNPTASYDLVLASCPAMSHETMARWGVLTTLVSEK